jgi:hypothetical protein
MVPGTVFIGHEGDFAAGRHSRLTGHVAKTPGAVE